MFRTKITIKMKNIIHTEHPSVWPVCTQSQSSEQWEIPAEEWGIVIRQERDRGVSGIASGRCDRSELIERSDRGIKHRAILYTRTLVVCRLKGPDNYVIRRTIGSGGMLTYGIIDRRDDIYCLCRSDRGVKVRVINTGHAGKMWERCSVGGWSGGFNQPPVIRRWNVPMWTRRYATGQANFNWRKIAGQLFHRPRMTGEERFFLSYLVFAQYNTAPRCCQLLDWLAIRRWKRGFNYRASVAASNARGASDGRSS